MPEISITCLDEDGKRHRYETNVISVKAYRAYCDLMSKNTNYDMLENMYFNMRMLQELYAERPTMEELKTVQVSQMLYATNALHFVMQQIVTPKFNELSDEKPEEIEKSIFDDYDAENGYLDEERKNDGSIWNALKENVDRIVKIGTRVLNTGYSECMQSDIMTLLEYVKFEVDTASENEQK